jgi:hypothetical protein
MRFQDIHEYDGRTCYATTNESLGMWKELLDGIEVDHAASICSGGEVGFFTIAPRARERVVLIDHAYGSLYFAMAKYKIIEKLGAKKAHELLTSEDGGKIRAELDKAVKGLLPDAAMRDVNGQWPSKASPYYDPYYRRNMLKTAWGNITEDDLAALRRARTKITFAHGDINDLSDLGPFDLVYLSNALSYLGREGAKGGRSGNRSYSYGAPKESEYRVENIVKPGGFVCFTYNSGVPPACTEAWKIITERKPQEVAAKYKDSSMSHSWRYVVAQIPEKGVKAA